LGDLSIAVQEQTLRVDPGTISSFRQRIGFEIIVATQPSVVVLVRTREVICSISALRRMMRENPELAKNNGELASQTQLHWLDLTVGQDL